MKKMMIYIIICAMLLTFIVGCGKSDKLDEVTKIVIVTPAGGPTLAILPMLEEDLLEKYNIEIDFKMVSAVNAISADLVSENIDVAIIPTNLASNLYNKGVNYKIAGIATWGNVFLIGNEKIESIEDIKGKEITSFGQGLTPDLIFKYLLKENGIDAEKDIKINYLAGVSAVAPMSVIY